MNRIGVHTSTSGECNLPRRLRTLGVALLTATAASAGAPNAARPPAVILTVIVDDLAWNNVGWHSGGGRENTTPHLAGLAAEGVILDRHYGHFTCTPSRSAFLTGRLPVHVQQTLANPDVASSGIPRNMTALPAKLRTAIPPYATHVVGKWDVGASTETHFPTGRGFDTSLVYVEHMNFYYTQTICPTGTGCDMGKYAYLRDMWDTAGPAAPNPSETYIEYLFRDRLLETIAAHDMANGPLYLQYDSHVAHWPLQVPQEWYDRFLWVDDDEAACGDDIPHVWPGANASVLSCRRQLLAMVALVDEVVGNVTAAIRARGWWNDTLMIFTPDNGGSIGTRENAGSNFPLRGGKYDAFEGGVRTAAFVSGGYLPPSARGTTLEAPVHIADWFATLCGLAGVDPADARAAAASPPLPPVDSVDVWPLLTGANGSSPRTEIPVSPSVLMQFDDGGRAGAPIWKLMVGKFSRAGWQGPTYPNASSPASDPDAVDHDCGAGCLFDVRADPTEHDDLAAAQPARVSAMAARLAVLRAGMFSNNDTGANLCPPGTPGDCACWMAANVYGGYLGPWQA